MSPLPALITLLTLILYLILTINVSRARLKFGIKPPQMSGDPDFERVIRVQQNTLEQIVVFLPALWLFCKFVSPIWGTGLGVIWIIGRILYAWGYYQAAEKRFIGFGISSLTNLILLIGALIGAGLNLATFT
ncbi:MAPEG family protein [Kovacikia minuta]|uniref:MAPEG family protein n=1 Tax=Kovacikia minuta TaxID=2931930 RepID=UPI001CEDE3FC|nr:MAPEG family protein [Kovacikia minuta]